MKRALKNLIWHDSLPSYEVVLVRAHGIVSVQTLESLWQFPARVEKAATGEDLKIFRDFVCVPGPSPSRLQWVRVKGVLRHPWRGNLFSINTVGAVLDCSPNHPIKKQVSYGPGKLGYEYIPAGSLRPGQHLTGRPFCKESGHRRFAGQKGCSELFIGSTDLAWFYGFFAAEGWIHRNLAAVCNSNRKLLDRASQVLRDIFHFSPCFNSPRKGVTEVDVRCQRLADHLHDVCYLPGSRPSSRTKIVPVVVLNGPQEIREVWLEGYFCGDAGHRRGAVASVGSVSRSLLLGVSYLCRRGFTAHIRQDKPDWISLTFRKERPGLKGRSTTPRRNRLQIKKILTKKYKGFLYDLVNVESRDHSYHAGIGNIRIKPVRTSQGPQNQTRRSPIQAMRLAAASWRPRSTQ